MWDDIHHWKFVAQPCRLPLSSVVTKIRDVLTEAEGTYLAAAGYLHPMAHTLPVSKTFLQSHFQAEAYQAHSGHSVVIIDECVGKVYKHCLDSDDSNRLLALLHDIKPNKSVFPEALKFLALSDHTVRMFFEFPLVRPPLPPAAVKQHAKAFFCLVYEAIKELHDNCHCAHLDVRLANICLDNSGYGVKLIDLDRSETVSTLAENSRSVMYGAHSSVMYKVDPKWTVAKVDWKQLGILIFAVMNEIHGNAYHTTTPEPKSNFLTHLITSGEYREEQRRIWIGLHMNAISHRNS